MIHEAAGLKIQMSLKYGKINCKLVCRKYFFLTFVSLMAHLVEHEEVLFCSLKSI